MHGDAPLTPEAVSTTLEELGDQNAQALTMIENFVGDHPDPIAAVTELLGQRDDHTWNTDGGNVPVTFTRV
jgi:hypothetical protein